MTDESPCRNDCLSPSRFPATIRNRPGLSRVNYRIGSYADIREAIMRALNRNTLLAHWTHRSPDDPGIALLEGAAVLGDILTFYQDTYANETFLTTARQRQSIAELAALTGYRLSPGIGGETLLAFHVSGRKDVSVPAHFPVTAQVQGLEEDADFETTEATLAVPALGRFFLHRPWHHEDIQNEATCFSVDTADLNAGGWHPAPGDRLMLVAWSADDRPKRQTVIVKKISERFEHTEIEIEGSWQSGFVGAAISAYRLGRSFRAFGGSGPDTITRVEDGEVLQDEVDFAQSDLGGFSLDQEVYDIPVGARLLIDLQVSENPSGRGTAYFFNKRIQSVAPETVTRGALTGGATRIEFDSAMLPAGLTSPVYSDIRTVTLYETIGPSFTFQGKRVHTDAADTLMLYFFGDSETYEKLDKRPVLLEKEGQTEQASVAIDPAHVSADSQMRLRPLALSKNLETFTIEDFPLDAPQVTVYGNLAGATQGKTEKEAVLGNGDNREQFQTFKLPKAPLTYFRSKSATPPELPRLEIYVNGKLWKHVPSFFGHTGLEEIYIVRQDAAGESWVQFGDGKTGMRLPSGIKNVTAVYRTGTAAQGALKEGTTVQPGKSLTALEKIFMPCTAWGGAQPEQGDKAREAAPGKLQSLGRLVGLGDYESEALAIPGVVKALARWDLRDNIPDIEMTLLMEAARGGEFKAVEDILNKSNICRGPDRFPISPQQGMFLYVYVDIILAIDPTLKEKEVLQAVWKALGISGSEADGIDGSKGLFGVYGRAFGQNEYASRIAGTVQNIAGVLWAKVVKLGEIGESDDPAELTVTAADKHLFDRVSCDGRHVLALYKNHLQLSVAKEDSAKGCPDE